MSAQPSSSIVLTGSKPANLELMPRADARAIWSGFREQFEKYAETAKTLKVTDASQVAEMKMAREARLALKGLRVAIEHKRLELVEGYKAEAKRIDTTARELRLLIEPMEAVLLEQEQFAERAKAEQVAELKWTREAQLTPLGVNVANYRLGEMSEQEYASLLEASIRAHEALIIQREREKEEAEARAKAEEAERQKIREENARLRKEREEIEKKAQADRQRMEAAARAEREAAARKQAEADAALERERAESRAAQEKERKAREAAEAELTRQREAEEAARRAEEEAKARAEAAPDKEKLLQLAEAVRGIHVPVLSTKRGIQCLKAISPQWLALVRLIEEQAATL